jgi:mono/diheme cytochrome c family protein
LGDPDGDVVTPNPNPKPLVSADGPGIGALPPSPQLDSMKGPMTTQSLRGLALSGPMHWRGDRTGSQCFSIDTVGNSNCEDQAFNAFNVAFPGLIGRDAQLPTADMQAFTNFALRLTYPPNPIRALDNSMTPQEQAGSDLYNNQSRLTDTVANCNGCHVLDRSQGFFGTSGGTTFEMETQEFKVPHLRNAYQKVGMFGQMPMSFIPGSGMDMGPQVRGTGFLHDGSISTLKTFLTATVFDTNATEEANIEAFIMAFDSDLAPIVGQQVTLTDTNLSDVQARIDLLFERSATQFPETGALECELVVKGVINGERRGWLRVGSLSTPAFLSDRRTEGNWAWDGCMTPWPNNCLLDAAAEPGQALTFTCAPPGSGFRMSVDRDRDNLWDYDDPVPDYFNSPDCSIGRTTPAGGAGAVLFLMVLGVFACRVTIGRRRRS